VWVFSWKKGSTMPRLELAGLEKAMMPLVPPFFVIP